jgi:hypothetical protein
LPAQLDGLAQLLESAAGRLERLLQRRIKNSCSVRNQRHDPDADQYQQKPLYKADACYGLVQLFQQPIEVFFHDGSPVFYLVNISQTLQD